ncbi:unnamed protein product [Fusarium graminearum]|uniref:Uncharacterized protein n=1 Tax=Gibberella zeae TaxID=5518 RepID=A0A9N8RL97_GIBZA|nr:unnamed protein product [Fusarium graminearum]CAG2001019.1 unnamed protein product [Fusarium graminearum]
MHWNLTSIISSNCIVNAELQTPLPDVCLHLQTLPPVDRPEWQREAGRNWSSNLSGSRPTLFSPTEFFLPSDHSLLANSLEITELTMTQTAGGHMAQHSVPFPLVIIIAMIATYLYPANLPGPMHKLRLKDIYRSRHYATQRAARSVIKRAQNLAASEIVQIAADLRKLVKKYYTSATSYSPTQGDFQYFLCAVFYLWHSNRPIPAKPVLRDPTFDERTIHVGYLRHDLDPVDGLLHDGRDNRLIFDDAFLFIDFNDETMIVSFIFVDGNGFEIDPEDVDIFSEYASTEDRNVTLFHHYEDSERIRVMDHNWHVAIWSARRKIKRFAEIGVTASEAANWPNRLETEYMEPFMTVERVLEVYELDFD